MSFRCESIRPASRLLKTHWVMVVMDQYTRRIIGFAVHAGNADGPALCRMFNDARYRLLKPGRVSRYRPGPGWRGGSGNSLQWNRVPDPAVLWWGGDALIQLLGGNGCFCAWSCAPGPGSDDVLTGIIGQHFILHHITGNSAVIETFQQ